MNKSENQKMDQEIKDTQTILIVEDEIIIAMNESRVLSNAGYSVFYALSGEKAIDKVNSGEKIDLILMDIDLGKGMDGVQTAEIILKEHNIPIVFLSSHMEKEIVEKTERVTSYGYIYKNSGESILLASIKMVFKLFAAHRKIMEDEKRYKLLSEQFYLAIRISKLGMWEWEIQTGKIVWNDSLFDLFGVKKEDFSGYYSDYRERIEPEDPEYYQGEIEKVLRGEKNYDSVFRITRPDGSIRFMRSTGIVERDSNGEPLRMTGISIDITRQKQTEIKLREKEKELEEVQRVAKVVSWEWFIENETMSLSEELSRLFGFEKRETQLNCEALSSVLTPESWASLEVSADKTIDTGKPFELDLEFILPNGLGRWVFMRGEAGYNAENKLIKLHGTAQDITARKRHEQKILSELKLNHKILNTNFIGIVIFKASGQCIFANQTAATTVGTTVEQLLSHNFHHLESWKKYGIYPIAMNSLNQKTEEQIETYMKTMHGKELWIRLHFCPIEFEDELHLLAFISDITGQKVAEENVKQSEKKFKIIFNQSPVGIVLHDAQGKLSDANPAALRLFGIKDLNHVGEFNLFDDPHLPESLKTSLKHGIHIVGENEINFNPEILKERFKFESVRSGINYFKFYFDPINTTDITGNDITQSDPSDPAGYLVHIIDINDQKQNEILLQNTIKEKNILLRELQHRVKNNLNVIHSLLYLEMDQLNDERSRQVFINAQSRIQTIANLYEKLYQSKGFDTIELKTYIKDLAFSLLEAYSMESKRIKLTTHLDKVKLDIRRAVPIGLIVNELMSNALKYAFPNRGEGEIRIEFHLKDGQFLLCISDNGIGFHSEGPNDKNEKMGLRLVRMLSEQIDALFTITPKKGTKACVTFKL